MHKKVRSLVLASLITVSSTGQVLAFSNKEVSTDTSSKQINKVVVKDNENDNKLIDEENTKIVNVEGTSYTVVDLKQGNLSNTEFKLNDQKITPTPVTDDGSIVKFEVNPTEIAKVDVIQGDVTDSIILNSKGKKFTKVINNEAPDKILVSGPLDIFEYHQTNYDKNGNVRTLPSKTTFNVVNEGQPEIDKTIPALTSKRTKLGEDIVINVDTDFTEYKNWQKNIYSVEKVYEGTNTSAKLQYSIENGKVIIDGNSSAIEGRNAIHKIKIKSKGFNDAYVNIETIKKAGKLQLSGDFNFWANNDLLFELVGFNYGATNPIYKVLLDGKVLHGDCVDYHVVSNLVRLENKALSKLTKGKHTITVKAHGYEDYTRNFYLEEAPKGSSNPTLGTKEAKSENSSTVASKVTNKLAAKSKPTFDVLSSASGGGGGGSTSEGGATGYIRANLVYDFDLLANAFILRNIGMSTKYSTSVLSYWNAMTKDAILTKGSQKVVDYQNYKNALNEAYESDYFTFKDYYNKLAESDYVNKPYSVKHILEDGLLGDVKSYSEENLKVAPNLKVIKSDGNIILSYENNEEYTKNIENIRVGMTILNKSSYDILDGKITIKDTSKFAKGSNEISVLANGYKTNKTSVDLSQGVETLAPKKDADNNITIELKNDYKNAIKGLTINGKSLFNNTQLGGDNGDYSFIDNTLVLKNKLFKGKEDKQQTLAIKANGYEDSITIFTPSELKTVDAKKMEIPSFLKLNNKNSYKPNERVIIDVEQAMNSNYKKAITSVLVDNKEVDYKTCLDEFYSIELSGENFRKAKSYNIVIKANNYKDYEVKLEVKGDNTSVPDTEVEKPNIEVEKDLWGDYAFTAKDAEYISNITNVLVNDKELEEASSSFASEGFYKNGNKITILSTLDGGSKVVFKSNGYEDYTYNTPLLSVEKINVSKDSDGYYKFANSQYNWTDNVQVYLNGKLLKKDEGYKSSYGVVTILQNLKEGDKLSIKSKGYEEYNYSVESFGNKVKAEYNSYSHRYSFNSADDNWKNKITSVKINGNEIEKSTDLSPTKGYKLNYSGGIDICESLENGDKLEIKADGYKDYIYENTKITAKDVEIKVDDKFNAMNGISAIDSTGSDITDKIKVVENTVDTTKSGEYKVVYNVKGALGGSVSKTIKVTVKNNEKPVIKVSTPTAKVDVASYNSNKITWNKVSKASGYQVYRSTSKDGKYAPIKTIKSGNTVNYTDAKLTTGKTYYYKVRAYKTVNGSKTYSNYSKIVSAKPKLITPSATLSSKNKKVYVKWNKVSGASGYQVYRATSKNGKYSLAKAVNSSTTSYTNTGVSKNKGYYYKVRAYKKVDGKKVYSSYSSIKYIKVR